MKQEKINSLLNELVEYGFYVKDTVCPGSSDLLYIVSYYIKWFTTSWTYSISSQNIYIGHGHPVFSNRNS